MEEQFYKEILDKLHSAVYVRDLDRKIIYLNKKAKLLGGGLADDDATQYKCFDLFGDDNNQCALDCAIEKEVLQGRAVKNMERTVKVQDGRIKTLEVSATPYFLNSSVAGAIVILKDITDQKIEEESRRNSAALDMSLNIYDEETKGYNKSYLMERIHSEFLVSRRHSLPLSCMMIEIDNFCEIQREYGHQCARSMIRKLADLLRERLRRSDLIFRFSERQFAVILQYTRLQSALSVADELKSKIRHVLSNGGREHTVSIGLAEITSQVYNSQELIELALNGLQSAKNRGNTVTALQD